MILRTNNKETRNKLRKREGKKQYPEERSNAQKRKKREHPEERRVNGAIEKKELKEGRNLDRGSV